jgi:hypothetical protein
MSAGCKRTGADMMRRGLRRRTGEALAARGWSDRSNSRAPDWFPQASFSIAKGAA